MRLIMIKFFIKYVSDTLLF